MTNETYHIKNAIIESTEICIDDHTALNGWLHLKHDLGSQEFKGHLLYLNESFINYNILSRAGHWLYRVLEIADVKNWNQLIGKAIRIKHNAHKDIIAIGHIIYDDWFEPGEDFKDLKV